MKSIYLSVFAILATSAAWAGMSPQQPAASENDATGAFVLLGLTLMVVLVGAAGSAVASRKSQDLDITAEDVNEDDGF